MPLAVLGSAGMGLVWGIVTSAIHARHHPLRVILWLAASTGAVAGTAAWMAGGAGAAWAAGTVGAGWLLRRMLESIVRG